VTAIGLVFLAGNLVAVAAPPVDGNGRNACAVWTQATAKTTKSVLVALEVQQLKRIALSWGFREIFNIAFVLALVCDILAVSVLYLESRIRVWATLISWDNPRLSPWC
jgi:hypothetical protein